jgi:CRP-like cAMP-binding protein
MTYALRDFTGNGLLDALTAQESNRPRFLLEPVSLGLKQSLYRSGDEIDFIYFPIHGMVSVVSLLQDGSSVEIGTIGNEGLVGLPALLGKPVSPDEVLVTGEGAGLRATANVVRDEFDHCVAFRGAVLRFTQFFLEQVAQSAACNARHQLEARCARWLLLIQHRLQADQYPLTQEFLATMLGARRPGVTVAAGALQRAGFISYAHGQVTILDQAGLEAAACECHGSYKNRIEHLLGS